MHRTLRRDRGFSFIELLAYMAIAALLILAAIPQFNQYRQKAVVSNMRDTAHNASLAAEAANIDAVAARATHEGAVRLASTRIRLAASTTTFDAIRGAVAAVKPNAGETVAVTDEGSTNYLITVTSSKIAATTKVVYASTYATTDSIRVAPGLTTIKDGKAVGQDAAEATTPPSSALANAATCTADAKQPKPTTATIDLTRGAIATTAGTRSDQWGVSYRYSDPTTYRLGRSEYGDGNQGAATNAKMWIGSQQVCDFPTNNLWITQNEALNSPYHPWNLGLLFNNTNEPNLFTAAQATAHEDVTLAFDFKGTHYVVKVPWDSSWTQDGTQRDLSDIGGGSDDEGPM